MKKIVIFASGSGSNAQNIALYCREKNIASVVGIYTNNPSAKVIDRAKKMQINFEIFDKKQLLNGEVLHLIDQINPDLIILAGFLLQFPESIIDKYPNKIINVHPALLPSYGGKGMYGMHIHNAVYQNQELETGITIHYVNKNYDEGQIIFQIKTDIKNCKSPDEIAQKIAILEMEHFPKVIEKLL
jgi:phosphoribosylglycinamide formyltransferase-1